MMRNAEIADAFDELGDLYELDGAVVYRVLAYRNAAKAIRDSAASVEEMARAGTAAKLPGVGKTIAEKIDALLDTGSIPAADKLKAKFPAGLVEITRIPGLGPKRARKLFDELGISSLDELRAAAEQQQLREVAGFGAKAEENILTALAAGADGQPKARTLLSRALGIGEPLVEALREHSASDRVELAGSARRMAETCKDLDIVATANDAEALAKAFGALPLIEEVHSSGPAGVRATTNNGMSVDLRIVPPENFGNLLQHFTGSGRHNEALRTWAVKQGFHISEYGVIDDSTETTHACTTEEQVYERVGLPYIEPELRENRGEIEAARAGKLPELVRMEDIRGDLHCHTTASDGRNSIEEMVQGALERGYEYLAITDHSASHGFGNDVQPDELLRQIERIREIDSATKSLAVLAGSEVNVLPNGSLDYEDDVLEQLELREAYALDIEKVVEAALRTGTFLEINSAPDRRDLNEQNARHAAEAGVTLVIDSDSHGVETLANIRYGLATARRGWVSAGQVANTRPWKELDKLRKRGGR